MPTTNDWINRATGKSGTQAGGGAGAIGGGAIGGRGGQPKPPITKGLANVGPNAAYANSNTDPSTRPRRKRY